MSIKIGCLHAHYSNIAYIEQWAAFENVEWIHYVDPGLIARMASEAGFGSGKAAAKVQEQLDWIAASGADAILVTCTQYIAVIDAAGIRTAVPAVKSDEPFFNYMCSTPGPQALFFTNPATVDGTLRRLTEYASSRSLELGPIDVQVIGHAFELIMSGQQEWYAAEVSKHVKAYAAGHPERAVAVAQLSMAGAAAAVERESGLPVGSPLKPLIRQLAEQFNLVPTGR